MRLEPQAELDRRVDEGANAIEGDDQRLRAVAEVERDLASLRR
jgi:hypothetical protein